MFVISVRISGLSIRWRSTSGSVCSLIHDSFGQFWAFATAKTPLSFSIPFRNKPIHAINSPTREASEWCSFRNTWLEVSWFTAGRTWIVSRIAGQTVRQNRIVMIFNRNLHVDEEGWATGSSAAWHTEVLSVDAPTSTTIAGRSDSDSVSDSISSSGIELDPSTELCCKFWRAASLPLVEVTIWQRLLHECDALKHGHLVVWHWERQLHGFGG